MMEKALLEPNKSVGGIYIGKSIDNYISGARYDFFSKSDDLLEDLYIFHSPPISVFVDDNKIVTGIKCSKECYWEEINLIGCNIDTFTEIFGQEPDSIEKIYVLVNSRGQNQKVYDFDSLGLQIWTWQDKIVSIFVSNYDSITSNDK